ncbi:hypothetical protein RRG08_064925 [Elysia crispata]|uniref:Uncharacterized protein n=1 Tax=Elysia crispata TaxID=231223 RepID=A0AAE1CJB5_9GAST|nr:hypothetical protein RRG08_064925 [Elysia crispata]
MVFTTSSGRVHAVKQNISSPLQKASERDPLNGHSTRDCQRPWPFASGYHLDGVPEVCQERSRPRHSGTRLIYALTTIPGARLLSPGVQSQNNNKLTARASYTGAGQEDSLVFLFTPVYFDILGRSATKEKVLHGGCMPFVTPRQ